jgi:hypothetical protein
MSKRLVLLATVLGCLAPLLPASPALASGPVKIAKIHSGQTRTVQLKGWKVISAPSTDNQFYVFPSTKIGPGHSLTLYTGTGSNTATKRYWGAGSPVWNNDGDKAVLKNALGTIVDTCQYVGGGTTAFC